MKNLLIFLLLISFPICSQTITDEYFETNGEAYFSFTVFNKVELQELTKIISIDNFDGKNVFAYASRQEFRKFEKLGYRVTLLPHPGDVPVRMGNPKASGTWDTYPTYEQYESMMYTYAAQYPDLCRIVNAGSTTQGRKILFAVISDNVSAAEEEPRFMYSSSMHGDETAAYVNMIRLIDYLLNGYEIDQRVTNLVNNLEIWINPNANPDGTYRSGNSTVTGARRGNANNIDINRNFRDPVAGLHPDGNSYQPETIIMMNLADTYGFDLSANFHGGAEVANYPWDSRVARHADDNWFIYISRRYADTVHVNSPNTTYMRGFNNGITNGWDWYSVYGGRQDYFTYFARGREITFELSNTKLIAASYIPTIWNYNYKSWLGYMEELLTGIQGTVKDPSGAPVKAMITVAGHDNTNSEVYSDSLTGAYSRMIYSGTYSITFTAPGYDSYTVSNVTTANGTKTPLNVTLYPTGWVPVELTGFRVNRTGSVADVAWETATETNNAGFDIEISPDGNSYKSVLFAEGKGNSTVGVSYRHKITLPDGRDYYIRLKQTDFDGTATYSKAVFTEGISVQGFRITSAYPNPFNPATRVNFELAEPSDLTLAVYSPEGAVAKEISYGYREAGAYSETVDFSELAGGVYIIQLRAGSGIQNKKVVYLK